MRSAGALVLIAFALVTSVFTLYHAPSYTLLPLSVGAPEVTPFALVAGILGNLLAMTSRRLIVRRIAIFSLLPAVFAPANALLRIPRTIRSFDATMTTAGVNPGSGRAISVAALFTGLPRADVLIERDLTFSNGEGYSLALDIYRPRASGPYPIVLQTFAGAWRGGTRTDNATFASALASRGYVVASIDYRLAPRWRWPVQLDDTRAALQWIKTHGAEHDGDPARIVALGRSSGAQLAFINAMTAGDPAIRAIVLFYSPVNLTEGYRVPPVPDTLGLRKIETDFIGGTPDDLPDAYRAASPITYADQPHPPVLLVHGARDRIVYPQYEATLHDHLRRSGLSIFLLIPWADHGFDAVSFGPSAQLALYYTTAFLSSVVK